MEGLGIFFISKEVGQKKTKKSGLWYMVFYKKIGAEVMFLRPS